MSSTGARPSPSGRIRAPLRDAIRALALGLWVALLSGIVETLILLVRREWLGQFVWAPGPIWWMTPASTILLLVPIAALVAIGAALSPRRVPPRTRVFVFTLVALAGLLLMVPRIHPATLLVLGAGIAAAAARTSESGPRPLRRLFAPTPRSALAVLGFWGAAGLGLAAASRPAASTAVAAEGRPNVLLLILDTVRASSTSLYGYEHPTTPYLDALADSSVVFERAIAPSSWTLPSHASMFTGRSARALRADWHVPLSNRFPTLAEVLGDAGYETAAFTANFMYTDREKGLGRGFGVYDDYRATWRQVGLSSTLGQMVRVWGRELRGGGGVRSIARRLVDARPPPERWSDRKAAEHVNEEFLGWLRRAPRRPYFAFLNYFDAHRPYHAPDSTLRAVRAWGSGNVGYDAAILHLDGSIRHLLDRMAAMGALENTIVVVTADHGELFGEHGLHGHGNSLYYPLLHVPLLIYAPGRARPGRVSETVSLSNLPATVLDLAGLAARFPRRSLARRCEDPGPAASDRAAAIAEVRRAKNVPDIQPVSRGDLRSIVEDDFQYILGEDGREELYRLSTDPAETRNLADRPRWQGKLAELRRAVAADPPSCPG